MALSGRMKIVSGSVTRSSVSKSSRERGGSALTPLVSDDDGERVSCALEVGAVANVTESRGRSVVGVQRVVDQMPVESRELAL